MSEARELMTQIGALQSELDRLRDELERERMRLAACSTVALCNTPETAAEARKMHDDYRSDACDLVAAAVDREMRLRKENAGLWSALNGMLTQFGMDEAEWNKPVFDVARAALQGASSHEA